MTFIPPSAETIQSRSTLAQERIYYAQNKDTVERLIAEGNPINRPNMGRYNPAVKPKGFFREMVSPYTRSATQLKTLRWMGAGNLAIDTLSGRAGFNLDTLANVAAIASFFPPLAGLAIPVGIYYLTKALGNFYDAFTGKGFFSNMFAGVINTICALPVAKLFTHGSKLIAAARTAEGTMQWGKLGYLTSKMCYGGEATNSFISGINWLKGIGQSSNKLQTAQGLATKGRDGIWKLLDWFMSGRTAAKAGAGSVDDFVGLGIA